MDKREYYAEGNYQKFNKSDLENNDIVTYRNGKRGIINLDFKIIVSEDLNGFVHLSSYTSALTCSGIEAWDIVKVQRADYIHQFMKAGWDKTPIIWERQETVEMTLAEVCKALGKNVKIVKE